jgi:uncharacterized protein (TIGR02996 family)
VEGISGNFLLSAAARFTLPALRRRIELAGMTRNDFLRAIVADPGDDLKRLLYSDWLEEFGTGDRDAATVEFIRVSCDRRQRASGQMPQKAYLWIGGNWRRLVPSLVARHQQYPGAADDLFKYRAGRIIALGLRLNHPRDHIPRYRYSCEVHFWKGFVLKFTDWCNLSHDALEKALRVDQPILFLGKQ